MQGPAEAAEALIEELGIIEPSEIDVEAIAFDAGLEIRYGSLKGCEATLVGVGNSGIATINRSASIGRERFSAAHEIGHWKLHRGRSFVCRAADASDNLAENRQVEKDADRFASHLLMPRPLFAPRVPAGSRPDFGQLLDIAEEFSTSLQATFLRLADVNTLPVIVACYRNQRLRWKLNAPDVPRRWFLKSQLDEDSFAFDLATAGKRCPRLSKQSAETWFDNSDADNYEVLEQCYTSGDDILVLIYLYDESMWDVGFDPNLRIKRSSWQR